MRENVESVEGYVHLLAPSFAIRPGFESFWKRFCSSRRRRAIIPQCTLNVLDVWGGEHNVEAVRPLARRAAWLLRRGQPRRDNDSRRTFADEAAIRTELIEHSTAVRCPIVFLTDHPGTILAAECDQQATLPGYRTQREYATLSGFQDTLTVRPTWYPPARRSLFRRLAFWREVVDPVPRFGAANNERPLLNGQSAGVRVRSGTRLTTATGKVVILGNRLAAADGGEGELFALRGRPDLVCKVYHSQQQRPERIAKLAALTRRALTDDAVCWPRETVAVEDGTVVGFVMPLAARSEADSSLVRPAQPLTRGLLLAPARFQQEYPNWTRRHSVGLCLRLAELVARLHQLGVVIGDLSADNILVDWDAMTNDREGVWLVDCDSFQVEGLPCLVGREEYTRAGLQGVDFGAVLRTQEDDRFALAVLLFQVLNPGRHPFQCRGALGAPGDWIRAGVFSYAATADPRKPRVPTPYDAFAWSHLTPELRTLFARQFVSSRRAEPVEVEEWLDALYEYGIILSDPNRVFQSPFVGRFDLNIVPPVGYTEPPPPDPDASE